MMDNNFAKCEKRIVVVLTTLYTLLVVCMGLSTIMEELHGREYVVEGVYGSWWFVALWALTATLSGWYLLMKKVHRKLWVMVLHVSFLVILAGAFVTHVTSKEGMLHIRKGEEKIVFTDKKGKEHTLPFTVSLSAFEKVYYPGTDALMDYRSYILVGDEASKDTLCVSMNNIGKVSGYRFYQSSYDMDEEGTSLLVAYDPYGIAITYTGYLLLLVGIIMTLFSRHTRIRSLLRTACRPSMVALLVFLGLAQGKAAEIDKEIADEIGTVAVLYNGRVCPLNTAATEFVTKLCGSSSWEGHSANEIFIGWTIFYTEWEQQRIIKVKSKEVQKILGIEGKWACLRDFYTSQNDYKLKDKANDTSFAESTRKAIRETDEKVQVITMFYNSEMLRIFPLEHDGNIQWHKPGSTELPKDVGEAEFQFVNHAMDFLVKSILANDKEGAKNIIAKIKLYQREKAGEIIPSSTLLKAEILYNTLQGALWVVVGFMVMGFFFCYLFFSVRKNQWISLCHTAFIWLQMTFVSVLLFLRWGISGHIPVSNGFETMLFMAWVTMVMTIALGRLFTVLRAFGPVVSSFCLTVAMLAGGSPQVTPLMPVLQSPLLALHVATVMMAYAILAVMTMISIRCLFSKGNNGERESLTALSQFLLYPAVSLLAIGIFIGAVWANVSWGAYWSWDPKETWALITMMIYAIPLHRFSLFEKCTARKFHLFILFAFLTVLMTWFGVNYFLSGMHSYA